MRKYFLITISLTLFVNSFCKNYWECDDQRKFSCKPNQTCCQSLNANTAYTCHNQIDGVCCSDGRSICPIMHRCDMQNRLCIPELTTQAFIENEIEEADLQLEPIDSLNFAKGFLKGFALFSNVPNQDECLNKDPLITQNFVDIFNLIKSVTAKTDFKALFRQLFAKLIDTIQRIATISDSCLSWANELKNVTIALKNHVDAPGFINKIINHTILNIPTIVSKIKNAVNALKSNDYDQAGQIFGDATKFIIFWDFKKTMMFLEEETQYQI
jgi:hypothetical protein